MSHGDAQVSRHFRLAELLPAGWDGSVPGDVLGNLIALAEHLLEPGRDWLERPIDINDAWRPAAHNAAVGGVPHSDHLTGSAADIRARGADGESWQEATVRLFHWMRVNLAGKYGQLILEDHRAHEARESALWLHVALPSAKHPGAGDPNAVLLSSRPNHYQPYEEPHA